MWVACYSTQANPSRASSANDSDGPQVPAAQIKRYTKRIQAALKAARTPSDAAAPAPAKP